MIVRVYEYYNEGERLDKPKEYSGLLKMYAQKDGMGKYMLLRDLQ